MNIQPIDNHYPSRNSIVRDTYVVKIVTIGTITMSTSDFIGHYESSSGKIFKTVLSLGESYDNEIRACFEL